MRTDDAGVDGGKGGGKLAGINIKKPSVTGKGGGKPSGGAFLKGALLIAISGVAAKLLGAIYRIPLTNLLKSSGMGIYHMVFPFYTLLLAVSSAGIPAAISRLIAERLNIKDVAGADKIFRSSFIMMSIIGLALSIAMYFFSNNLAAMQQTPEAALCYKMIAPSVFLVSQIAVLRGYFQGRLNMLPTAASQIIEQVVKMAFSLTVAVSFLPDVPKAAAYSILAVTVSELAALLFLFAYYIINKKGQRRINLYSAFSGYKKMTAGNGPGKAYAKIQRTGYTAGDRKIYKCYKSPAALKVPHGKKAYRLTFTSAFAMVLMVSIPVTLGSIILPVSHIVDSILVVRYLTYVNGISPVSLYGLLSGPVNSIISLPVAAASGIAVASVPYISASRASGDNALIKEKVEQALKLTFIIALPCALGLYVFSYRSMSILYSALTAAELSIAARLLKLSVITLIFLPLMQTTVSILVALKRSIITTINLVIGVAVKVLLNLILLKNPMLNISAAALSAAVCYAITSALNLLYILQYAEISIKLSKVFFAPLACSVVAIGFAVGAFAALRYAFSGNVSFLIAIVLSAAVYIAASIKLKVFTKREINALPLLRRFVKKGA